jgi:MSHA pilin protein MshA
LEWGIAQLNCQKLPRKGIFFKHEAYLQRKPRVHLQDTGLEFAYKVLTVKTKAFLHFFFNDKVNSMKTMQRGFTLIELVMVIVILGVLAAVAIPKFVDLKSDAQLAAMNGVAGAAASAAAINYAGCSVLNNVVTANKCVKVNTCATISATLQGAAFPTGYSAAATTAELAAAAASNGVSNGCTLTLTGYTPPSAVTFQIVGAGN